MNQQVCASSLYVKVEIQHLVCASSLYANFDDLNNSPIIYLRYLFPFIKIQPLHTSLTGSYEI